jgi:serine/threonine protein kinase, bacterial
MRGSGTLGGDFSVVVRSPDVRPVGYHPMMPLAGGDHFAGFTVQRLLGAGGMGEVYLVQHPRLPRLEALKILPANATDDTYRTRFAREADLVATLFHPNIVGMHDRGEYEGQLWISMDYVDGTDAAKLLAEHPNGLPVGDVVEIVGAIANALDFAHHMGLLHRDVKPANILMTTETAGQRRIMLADFGIARYADYASGLTATNATIGTVAYAAPEQLLGHDTTGRADQYALAVTAFHLLTGSPPYGDSNPAVVISKVLTAGPPSLAATHPEFAALDPVLARGLTKNPADRFETCGEFAAALRAAAGAVAEPVRPTAVARPMQSEVTGVAPINVAPWTPPAASTNVASWTPPADPTNLAWEVPPPRSGATRVLAILVPITLAILLIGAVAFAVVATNVHTRRADGPPAWQPYVDAGKQGALNLTTIDYATVDADVQRIIDNGTGAFLDDFKNRAGPFKDQVRQLKSTSKGTVNGAGLETLDGDTAKVLIAVSVKTAVVDQPDQPLRSWRMRITVKRVGDGYKISNVEFVA